MDAGKFCLSSIPNHKLKYHFLAILCQGKTLGIGFKKKRFEPGYLVVIVSFMNNFTLSVVLPAYNEEENIEHTVNSCLIYLDKKFGDYEVVVVNDGSSDKTSEIVQRLTLNNSKIKLINHDINRGYGSALRTGFDNSIMDFIFFMDSDGQFDISELSQLIEKIEDNTAVIGYRRKRADTSIRLLNQKLYHQYIKIIFGLGVRDIDCAFKIFARSSYEKIKPIKSDGALFSAELLIKLLRSGLKIVEVPVNHYPRQFGSQTGANLGVIFKMFKESWKFRNDLG